MVDEFNAVVDTRLVESDRLAELDVDSEDVLLDVEDGCEMLKAWLNVNDALLESRRMKQNTIQLSAWLETQSIQDDLPFPPARSKTAPPPP